jgi:hypothetical protein
MKAVPDVLPPHIQELLNRKSSRDPISRFTSKLFTLLSYVEQFPGTESQVGVAWVGDDIFKMNKQILTNVMRIKLNTLNVNLRDLHFKIQHRDQDGWTLWKRDGFTKSSVGVMSEPGIAPFANTPPLPSYGYAPMHYPFSLGPFMRQGIDEFFSAAGTLWSHLAGGGNSQIDAYHFLRRAAERFREEGQQLQNAVDVLTAIITPTKTRLVMAGDFLKFMAMFGPEKTVMLKIASLLQCSHRTGEWLTFDLDQHALPRVFAAFEKTEPNCLAIHIFDQVSRVWNDPRTEANGGTQYLTDEHGAYYSSWEDYFTKHPVPATGDAPLLFR